MNCPRCGRQALAIPGDPEAAHRCVEASCRTRFVVTHQARLLPVGGDVRVAPIPTPPTRRPSRNTDPDTSHEGAEAVKVKLSERHFRIEAWALTRGTHGVTGFEVTEHFGNGWWKRLSELGQHGRLVATDRRRINPATGVNAVVWVHRNFS